MLDCIQGLSLEKKLPPTSGEGRVWKREGGGYFGRNDGEDQKKFFAFWKGNLR